MTVTLSSRYILLCMIYHDEGIAFTLIIADCCSTCSEIWIGRDVRASAVVLFVFSL